MADYLVLGQQAFKDGMTEDQIKHQHPQFRAAWRVAKKNYDQQHMPISSLKPEKIDRDAAAIKWTLTWNELDAITRLKPYNVLNGHSVWANALRKVVWDRRDEIKRHRDAVRMVKTIFDGIIQRGYDEGVLTDEECQYYLYTPTQLREVK